MNFADLLGAKKLMKAVAGFAFCMALFPLTCNAQPDAQQTQDNAEKTGRVAVIRREDGAWQLSAGGQPYFIRGVVFSPVKIGEDPGQATMRDWMTYDDDRDGRNDVAFQTWLDGNRNGRRDPDEPALGDFEWMKRMGVNTIRLYHTASNDPEMGDIYQKAPGIRLQFNHAPNKELLRELYRRYGIRVILGNFLGSWTIGSGASWESGTDYENPVHRENIKRSVRAMVLDHKDEPYILFWALGNENNIAEWSRCNARQKPEAYAKLIGELTDMIHALDPRHPVSVIDGDGNDMLAAYAQFAPNLDIIGYNSYRDAEGLLDLYRDIRQTFDRPVYLSESGRFAYSGGREDEDLQLNFIRNTWSSVQRASGDCAGADCAEDTRNAIGVTLFDWVDRWYMDGEPRRHNAGSRPFPGAPEGVSHEEWYGFVSLGNGLDSLMRRPRKSYDFLKSVWNEPKKSEETQTPEGPMS